MKNCIHLITCYAIFIFNDSTTLRIKSRWLVGNRLWITVPLDYVNEIDYNNPTYIVNIYIFKTGLSLVVGSLFGSLWIFPLLKAITLHSLAKDNQSADSIKFTSIFLLGKYSSNNYMSSYKLQMFHAAKIQFDTLTTTFFNILFSF